ncbi:MAG: helix-turn-helix domain-containing protein [Marmoricola sp.]
MLTTSPAVAPFLRERRRELDLRTDDLAERLGVHPTSLLRWERGERLPGPGHVVGLARALEVEVDAVAGFFDTWRPPAERSHRLRAPGLRAVRRAAGVPAAGLAVALDVPTHTVYNWESGRCGVPVRLLPRLSSALAVPEPLLRQLMRQQAVTAEAPARRSPLRRLRERAGLSQRRLADRSGLSCHAISRWERREDVPPLAALRKLARGLEVPVPTVAAAVGVEPPRVLDPRRWVAGDLCDVLRTLRAWGCLTQRELALRAGVSCDAVRSWESGRSVPREASRRRLERAFGLHPGALCAALPVTERPSGRARHDRPARAS